jgi:hypothetical protein
LAPARSPYAVVWAVPTSPYEARFGVPRFAPACAGRGGRGYAPHWAVSGTQNIALKVITSSRFRALTIYRRVGAPAYSPKCVAWGFSEVAYLRTSYEAVPPALALPEMKPERVPITVVTTVSRV